MLFKRSLTSIYYPIKEVCYQEFTFDLHFDQLFWLFYEKKLRRRVENDRFENTEIIYILIHAITEILSSLHTFLVASNVFIIVIQNKKINSIILGPLRWSAQFSQKTRTQPVYPNFSDF